MIFSLITTNTEHMVIELGNTLRVLSEPREDTRFVSQVLSSDRLYFSDADMVYFGIVFMYNKLKL